VRQKSLFHTLGRSLATWLLVLLCTQFMFVIQVAQACDFLSFEYDNTKCNAGSCVITATAVLDIFPDLGPTNPSSFFISDEGSTLPSGWQITAISSPQSGSFTNSPASFPVAVGAASIVEFETPQTYTISVTLEPVNSTETGTGVFRGNATAAGGIFPTEITPGTQITVDPEPSNCGVQSTLPSIGPPPKSIFVNSGETFDLAFTTVFDTAPRDLSWEITSGDAVFAGAYFSPSIGADIPLTTGATSGSGVIPDGGLNASGDLFLDVTAGSSTSTVVVNASPLCAPTDESIVQIFVAAGAVCGNGAVEGGETCDDGDATDAGTCNASCTGLTSCGDGVQQTPNGNGFSEQCDGGGETAACNANCTESICGDSELNTTAGEECDDGNTTNGDGCDSSCQSEAVCGNNLVEVGETCDDGNTSDGDGCDSSCISEVCGNGVLQPPAGELCDDGNLDDGDGCDSSCIPEQCGDNIINNGPPGGPGEDCDEGGVQSASCETNCKTPTCGDGIENTLVGEFCDTGGVDTASCDAVDCTAPVCGDGVINRAAGESCDDGNLDDEDGCSSTCQGEGGADRDRFFPNPVAAVIQAFSGISPEPIPLPACGPPTLSMPCRIANTRMNNLTKERDEVASPHDYSWPLNQDDSLTANQPRQAPPDGVTYPPALSSTTLRRSYAAKYFDAMLRVFAKMKQLEDSSPECVKGGCLKKPCFPCRIDTKQVEHYHTLLTDSIRRYMDYVVRLRAEQKQVRDGRGNKPSEFALKNSPDSGGQRPPTAQKMVSHIENLLKEERKKIEEYRKLFLDEKILVEELRRRCEGLAKTFSVSVCEKAPPTLEVPELIGYEIDKPLEKGSCLECEILYRTLVRLWFEKYVPPAKQLFAKYIPSEIKKFDRYVDLLRKLIRQTYKSPLAPPEKPDPARSRLGDRRNQNEAEYNKSLRALEKKAGVEKNQPIPEKFKPEEQAIVEKYEENDRRIAEENKKLDQKEDEAKRKKAGLIDKLYYQYLDCVEAKKKQNIECKVQAPMTCKPNGLTSCPNYCEYVCQPYYANVYQPMAATICQDLNADEKAANQEAKDLEKQIREIEKSLKKDGRTLNKIAPHLPSINKEFDALQEMDIGDMSEAQINRNNKISEFLDKVNQKTQEQKVNQEALEAKKKRLEELNTKRSKRNKQKRKKEYEAALKELELCQKYECKLPAAKQLNECPPPTGEAEPETEDKDGGGSGPEKKAGDDKKAAEDQKDDGQEDKPDDKGGDSGDDDGTKTRDGGGTPPVPIPPNPLPPPPSSDEVIYISAKDKDRKARTTAPRQPAPKPAPLPPPPPPPPPPPSTEVPCPPKGTTSEMVSSLGNTCFKILHPESVKKVLDALQEKELEEVRKNRSISDSTRRSLVREILDRYDDLESKAAELDSAISRMLLPEGDAPVRLPGDILSVEGLLGYYLPGMSSKSREAMTELLAQLWKPTAEMDDCLRKMRQLSDGKECTTALHSVSRTTSTPTAPSTTSPTTSTTSGTQAGSSAPSSVNLPRKTEPSISDFPVLVCGKSYLEAQKKILTQYGSIDVSSIDKALKNTPESAPICKEAAILCRAGTYARLAFLEQALADVQKDLASASATDAVNAVSSTFGFSSGGTSQSAALENKQREIQQSIDRLRSHLDKNCPLSTMSCHQLLSYRNHLRSFSGNDQVGPATLGAEIAGVEKDLEKLNCPESTKVVNGVVTWEEKDQNGRKVLVEKHPDGKIVRKTLDEEGNVLEIETTTEKVEDGKKVKVVHKGTPGGSLIRKVTTIEDPSSGVIETIEAVPDPYEPDEVIETVSRKQSQACEGDLQVLYNQYKKLIDQVNARFGKTSGADLSLDGLNMIFEFQQQNRAALNTLKEFKTCGAVPEVSIPCPKACGESSPVVQELKRLSNSHAFPPPALLESGKQQLLAAHRSSVERQIRDFYRDDRNRRDLNQYFGCQNLVKKIASSSPDGARDPLIASCPAQTFLSPVTFNAQVITYRDDNGRLVKIITDEYGRERRVIQTEDDVQITDSSGSNHHKVRRDDSGNVVELTLTENSGGIETKTTSVFEGAATSTQSDSGIKVAGGKEKTRTRVIKRGAKVLQKITITDPGTPQEEKTIEYYGDDGKVSYTQKFSAGKDNCEACKNINTQVLVGYRHWHGLFQQMKEKGIQVQDKDGSKRTVPSRDEVNRRISDAEKTHASVVSQLSTHRSQSVPTEAKAKAAYDKKLQELQGSHESALQDLKSVAKDAQESYAFSKQIMEGYQKWQNALEAQDKAALEKIKACHNAIQTKACVNYFRNPGIFGDQPELLTPPNKDQYLKGYAGSDAGPGGYNTGGTARKYIESPADVARRATEKPPEGVKVTTVPGGGKRIEVTKGNVTTITYENPDGSLQGIVVDEKNGSGELTKRTEIKPEGTRTITSKRSGNVTKVVVQPGQTETGGVKIYERNEDSYGRYTERKWNADGSFVSGQKTVDSPIGFQIFATDANGQPVGSALHSTVQVQGGAVLEVKTKELKPIEIPEPELPEGATWINKSNNHYRTSEGQEVIGLKPMPLQDPCYVTPEQKDFDRYVEDYLSPIRARVEQQYAAQDEEQQRRTGTKIPVTERPEFKDYHAEGQQVLAAAAQYVRLMKELRETSDETTARRRARDLENLFQSYASFKHFPAFKKLVRELEARVRAEYLDFVKSQARRRNETPDSRVSCPLGVYRFKNGAITLKLGVETENEEGVKTFVPVDENRKPIQSLVDAKPGATPSAGTVPPRRVEISGELQKAPETATVVACDLRLMVAFIEQQSRQPNVDPNRKKQFDALKPMLERAIQMRDQIAAERNALALKARIEEYQNYLLSKPQLLGVLQGLQKSAQDPARKAAQEKSPYAALFANFRSCNLGAVETHALGTIAPTFSAISGADLSSAVTNMDSEASRKARACYDYFRKKSNLNEYEGHLRSIFDQATRAAYQRLQAQQQQASSPDRYNAIQSDLDTYIAGAVDNSKWVDAQGVVKVKDPDLAQAITEFLRLKTSMTQYLDLVADLRNTSPTTNQTAFDDTMARLKKLFESNSNNKSFGKPLHQIIHDFEQGKLEYNGCEKTSLDRYGTDSGLVVVDWKKVNMVPNLCLDLKLTADFQKLPQILKRFQDRLNRKLKDPERTSKVMKQVLQQLQDRQYIDESQRLQLQNELIKPSSSQPVSS